MRRPCVCGTECRVCPGLGEPSPVACRQREQVCLGLSMQLTVVCAEHTCTCSHTRRLGFSMQHTGMSWAKAIAHDRRGERIRRSRPFLLGLKLQAGCYIESYNRDAAETRRQSCVVLVFLICDIAFPGPRSLEMLHRNNHMRNWLGRICRAGASWHIHSHCSSRHVLQEETDIRTSMFSSCVLYITL